MIRIVTFIAITAIVVVVVIPMHIVIITVVVFCIRHQRLTTTACWTTLRT